ncbi:hypothetical protein [Fidelibacter multiformis]|uniref:hypothetical protein n=1 Tax=Fidelibacter multiformis TaxID=3377529 RepID=UPI0037DD11B3
MMYFFDTSFTIKNMNVNDIFHYELRPDQGSNAWDAVDRDTFMDDMSKIKFWNGETWVDTFAVNV